MLAKRFARETGGDTEKQCDVYAVEIRSEEAFTAEVEKFKKQRDKLQSELDKARNANKKKDDELQRQKADLHDAYFAGGKGGSDNGSKYGDRNSKGGGDKNSGDRGKHCKFCYKLAAIEGRQKDPIPKARAAYNSHDTKDCRKKKEADEKEGNGDGGVRKPFDKKAFGGGTRSSSDGHGCS